MGHTGTVTRDGAAGVLVGLLFDAVGDVVGEGAVFANVGSGAVEAVDGACDGF